MVCVSLCVCCTFVAVLGVRSVQVVDGVHRVELDLREISVADSVELRGGLGRRRPRHVPSTDLKGKGGKKDA